MRLDLSAGAPLSVLAVGAHPDDIEIGAGGLLLGLTGKLARVRYVVLTGTPERHAEARAAARAFMPDAELDVTLLDLPEGRFPAAWQRVKDAVEAVARSEAPDLIIAPSAADAHQDHRTIGEIMPTVFRDQLYLAYEIPKWDGDLGRPSVYYPLSDESRGVRSNCCTSAIRLSTAGTGGTTRCSSAWPGCAEWSAGHAMPRRSPATS